MSQSAIDFAELQEMCWAQQMGDLSPEAAARLEQLVVGSAAACEYYIRYAGVCAYLEWPTAPHDQFSDQTINGVTGKEIARTPLFPFFTTTFHGTVGYIPSGWPVAYLIATVIFGLGLLIGSLVHVSEPTQVARQSSAPSRVDAELKMELVGRITGMVDCRWAGTAFDSPGVPLGRKYELASGLMEITYDTGARVILQGPVKYEVDSATGGFLSVGKLTARVEKQAEGGRRKAEESNTQPPIPNPLFAIRTPTATVTDLGTEFGVTVLGDGLTQVHVLRGAVDARIVDPRGSTPRHQRVTEGLAIEIGRKGTRIDAVAFAPRSFARRLDTPVDTPAEAAYINTVLADKPLGYWPLNEPAHFRKFLDRSGNGFHGYAMKKVASGQPGPLPGNSRAVAFNGDGNIDVG